MTNDATKNEIISYERTWSGELFEYDRFRTEGRGSGGTTDPLQSQDSLILSKDNAFLFAANAGSGTISVFRVSGAKLELVERAPSGGSEPLSIAQTGNLVYVLNGAAAGSVVGFHWDGRNLRQIPNSTTFLSQTSAGASSITASPDGTHLVVTERLTNNIDTLAIHPNGTLGPLVVNTSKNPGVFSARFAPNGALIVSETGPAHVTDGSTISSYAVLANGTISPVSQAIATLGSANCWNAITPNGKWVYASNAGSGSISGFSIGANGTLLPIGTTVVGINPPGSANLDTTISSDGKYLYTLNSGTGDIGIFAIQNDGTLINRGQADGLTANAGFNGIAAY